MAILAALGTFFAPLGAGLAAYWARHGVAVALKAAPVAAVAVAALLLYALIGHVDASPWLRYPLAGGVVALAVASFALGFEVRGALTKP